MLDRPRARASSLARVALGVVGAELVVGAVLHDPLRVARLLDGHPAPAAALGGAFVLAAGVDARAARRAAQRRAFVDPVTGAGTPAALDRHLRRSLATDVLPTVVHTVLEGLDEVRTAEGDAAADALQREAAVRLAVLAPTALVARLDRSSLTAVADDLADGGEAIAFAELVRDALHRPFGADEEVGFVAHVGVASAETDRFEPDAMVRRAVAAAERARHTGAAVVAEGALPRIVAASDPVVLADLRRALEEGELFLRFQPVMHLTSSTVVALEALVRWRHPTRGVLAPGDFLPAAERLGLGPSVGRWVLDAAVAQCAAWCAAGTYVPVSVNVSAAYVSDEAFADDVEQALEAHQLPPHLFELELTETASPPDLEAARRALVRLHRLGVNVALDGFGTGHASLSYLHELPVDTVKIDGSFVADLGRRPGDGVIVRSILALGRSLGVQVVAEGVHDERVARFLAELGCDLAQGFRWTRPLSGDDALAWTRACSASAERQRDAGGTAAGGGVVA